MQYEHDYRGAAEGSRNSAPEPLVGHVGSCPASLPPRVVITGSERLCLTLPLAEARRDLVLFVVPSISFNGIISPVPTYACDG